MENLGQIKPINEKIRTASVTAIKALHFVMFENTGDRKNRQRLRTFKGFTFSTGSEEFLTKVNVIADKLSFGHLTIICNILGLHYDETKEQLADKICRSLTDLNTLRALSGDKEENETDDEEECEDEVEGEVRTENEDDVKRVRRRKFRKKKEETDSYEDDDDACMAFEIPMRRPRAQQLKQNLKFAMNFNPLHSAPFRTLPTSNSTPLFRENVHPGNVILYSIILEPSKEL